MSTQILEAIEAAVPGITEGIRNRPLPSWIDPLKRHTDVWLGGFDIRHVEVTPIWNGPDGEIGTLVVNVLANDGVVAQARIAVQREDGQGTFGGWKIVRQDNLATLDWKDVQVGPRTVSQVTATFASLPEPFLLPGEIERPMDVEKLTELFRSLRDSWIDTGTSARDAAVRD